MFFHQAQKPAMGRRTFEGIIGVFKRLDEHAYKVRIFAFLGREFVRAIVEILQLGDEPLVLFFGANNRR